MVVAGKQICPCCGGKLRYYDKVKRVVRTKLRKTSQIEIRRLRCAVCGAIHRELPEVIFPYKQYDADVIEGVLEGFITCETLGFEDYPSEVTMTRWRSQKEQLLLWKNYTERSF